MIRRNHVLVLCGIFFAVFLNISISTVHAQAAAKPAVNPAPAPKPAAAKTAVAAQPEAAEAEAPAEEAAESEKEEDPIDTEIRFMKSLIRMRLPDYAQKCLDQLVQKNPDAKARASGIKIDILAGVGKYAEAEKLIASLPPDTLETWIMKLSLAEHYYEAGKMTEAKAGYDAFFKKYQKGPPAGMDKFYMEQAYKYALMLMFKNEEKQAVEAFRYVLLGKPPRDIEFKIRMDLAELCIKLAEKTKDKERDEYFVKAKEACEPVLWKDPGGPLFGKALMILAHVELIKGDKKAAKKLIDTNMPMLKELEKVIIENKISLDFSPMAECRYLLGTIAEEEGKELIKQDKKKEAQEPLTIALTHFVNVVAKYPTSQWAISAGTAQERVQAIMKGIGLNVEVPNFDRSQIVKALIKEAQSLFDQNRFQEASTKYLLYVNNVPEMDTSVAALGELSKCYLELGDTNYFKAVIGYLAERFNMDSKVNDNAGNALLRAAATAETRNDKELQQLTYDYYMRYFKTHKRMAGILYQFGDGKLKEKNYDQAINYFQNIVSNHVKSALYFPSLGKMSYCYTMINDYSNAIQVLTKTIDELPPCADELEARFRRGDAYRRTDRTVTAINEYVGIINEVNGKNKTAYSKTPEDTKKTTELMENVYFWKAYCYAMLNKPPEKIKDYQQKSIDDFTKFVADYPKSTLSPVALGRLGSLLYANGKSDDANKVFDRLLKEYKDSNEAKDVVFVQGMSLIELKQMPKAIEIFGRMLANEKAFTAQQFLRVGKIMYEAKEYPTAVKFYERAKANAKERSVWEPSLLGMGEAYYAQGNTAEAVKAIEEMLAKYPNSPLLVDAGFTLSKAYADLGSKEPDVTKKKPIFDKSRVAVASAMSAIPPTNTVMKFRANLQLADIQILMGNKDAATASYYRMLSFGDWNDAEIRPDMENALERGLPLLNDKELYEEVVTIGTKYLDACPRGRLIREVRRMRDAAKLKLSMSGKKVEAETTPPPQEGPAPVQAVDPDAAGSTKAVPPASAPSAVSPSVAPEPAPSASPATAESKAPAAVPAGQAPAPAGKSE